MAPEQAKGKPVDRRADIWAFGVVLYEMLNSGTLFAGETISETLAAVLTRKTDFDAVPLRVRNLLRSCLEKDPRKRLRDIGDAWRLREQPSAPATTPVPAARRAYLPWIAASILGMIAITLAALHFREAARKRRLRDSRFLRPRRDLSPNGWPYRLTAAISRSPVFCRRRRNAPLAAIVRLAGFTLPRDRRGTSSRSSGLRTADSWCINPPGRSARSILPEGRPKRWLMRRP